MDDLIVVGAGWSGIAATAFALSAGLKVRLIAQGIGSIIVTPGWISVWDSKADQAMSAVEALDVPNHPYVLAGAQALKQGLEAFKAFAQKIGVPYADSANGALSIPTALGITQHPTASIMSGAASIGSAPLFIGFNGWRDYYPALSGINHLMINLIDDHRAWDATPTDLARAFDDPATRRSVVKQIKPNLNGATSVGFPAVLRLDSPEQVHAELAQQLGVPVFEMPTLPPSVPGTRLFNKSRRYFLDQQVRIQVGHPVQRGLVENGVAVGVEVAAAGKPQSFRAKAVLLATGGLYGGGLFSDDRGHIWEALFNLPVQYNPDRTTWFNTDPLDPRGHPVHHFGIRVNDQMQPIDTAGNPVVDNLFICGKLIAQPEDPRAPLSMESSEGIALATAWKAVQAIRASQKTPSGQAAHP